MLYDAQYRGACDGFEGAECRWQALPSHLTSVIHRNESTSLFDTIRTFVAASVELRLCFETQHEEDEDAGKAIEDDESGAEPRARQSCNRACSAHTQRVSLVEGINCAAINIFTRATSGQLPFSGSSALRAGRNVPGLIVRSRDTGYMAHDLSFFFAQLLQRPREISAVVPSSRALAVAMTREIHPGSGNVVEFGPGTGKITRAILDRGVAAADLTLFEMNTAFCRRLGEKFPGVRIENCAAQSIRTLGIMDLGTVVSGLPLLSMPSHVRGEIVQSAFEALRPDGIFVQFTYGARPPLDEGLCRSIGLVAHFGGRVWSNLPPARIFIYRRESTHSADATSPNPGSHVAHHRQNGI